MSNNSRDKSSKNDKSSARFTAVNESPLTTSTSHGFRPGHQGSERDTRDEPSRARDDKRAVRPPEQVRHEGTRHRDNRSRPSAAASRASDQQRELWQREEQDARSELASKRPLQVQDRTPDPKRRMELPDPVRQTQSPDPAPSRQLWPSQLASSSRDASMPHETRQSLPLSSPDTSAAEGARNILPLPDQMGSADSDEDATRDTENTEPITDAERLANRPEQNLPVIRARKRQFANRTKTGCHTCRERKKKCDEAKPFCENCQRGGFECKGYGERRPTLEGKTRTPSRPTPSSAARANPPYATARADTYPVDHAWRDSQGMAVRPDERSQSLDDSYASADSTRPRSISDQVLHGNASTRPQSMLGYDAYGPFNSQSSQQNLARLARMGQAIAPGFHTNRGFDLSQSTAQIALRQNQMLRYTTPQLQNMTEKQKMLIGEPYRHFLDKELTNDRTACQIACRRFNDFDSRQDYPEPEHRWTLFRRILVPERLRRVRSADEPIGSMGYECHVESPFNCEYGYNIHIGKNVVIQRNCLIYDSCTIKIGDNCIIGPNVKMYGMSAPIDPGQRQGTQARFIGGPIVIEDDCFIGADVTILANRTIRKGSVVGAGTVVSRDVASNTVVAGSTMKLLRGLGPGGDLDQHRADIQQENDAAVTRMLNDAYGDGMIPWVSL